MVGKSAIFLCMGSILPNVTDELKKCDKLMIVVGAEKVPPEIYQLADWNIAVGSQPHSEVAAVAITMDRIADVEPLEKKFPGAELKIVPSEKGKRVIENVSD